MDEKANANSENRLWISEGLWESGGFPLKQDINPCDPACQQAGEG